MWEYKVIQIDRKELEEHLNKLGAQGWDLVNVDYDLPSGEAFAVAKRPKQK